MSVLTKKVINETMSMNVRVPKQLHADIDAINKKLEEYELGLEIVLSKVVIKAMKDAKREGEKVITEHEKKLKPSTPA
jgi:hypothetical protein